MSLNFIPNKNLDGEISCNLDAEYDAIFGQIVEIDNVYDEDGPCAMSGTVGDYTHEFNTDNSTVAIIGTAVLCGLDKLIDIMPEPTEEVTFFLARRFSICEGLSFWAPCTFGFADADAVRELYEQPIKTHDKIVARAMQALQIEGRGRKGITAQDVRFSAEAVSWEVN